MTGPAEVSAALTRLVGGTERPDDLHLVATYGGYWIAAIERDDGFEAIVHRDDEGRSFFPFFTGPEALRRALDQFAEDLPDRRIRTSQLTGAELVEIVAEEAARDTVVGVVVDFLGPADPVAFAVAGLELWRGA